MSRKFPALIEKVTSVSHLILVVVHYYLLILLEHVCVSHCFL